MSVSAKGPWHPAGETWRARAGERCCWARRFSQCHHHAQLSKSARVWESGRWSATSDGVLLTHPTKTQADSRRCTPVATYGT
jgi:hypothetical protein